MPIDIDVKVNLREHGPIIRTAVAALSKSLREQSLKNLSGAGLGKFGTKAYTTKIKKLGNIGYEIDSFLTPRFLKVFETGGTSIAGNRRGSPRPARWAKSGAFHRKGERFDFERAVLWIPVPPLKVKVRKYGGKLFRPPGTNVLISTAGRKVVYIGVKSITNRKRTGLENIAMVEASKFVGYMKQGIYDGGKSASGSGSP